MALDPRVGSQDVTVRFRRTPNGRKRRPGLVWKRVRRLGFYLLLAVIATYLFFPFYWAVNSSLKTPAQIAMSPATFIPRHPVTGEVSLFTGNYATMLRSDTLQRAMAVSAFVATSVTLLSLAVGSFAAFALGKLRFRGKTASLYAILSMTMFPQIAILAGLYAIIRTLNLQPLTSMILTYLLFSLPFTVWVLTAYFKALPADVIQAAQADGATVLQLLRLVVLPMSAPALVTTGILAFIASWNEYLYALTFTTIRPEYRTIPVAIAFFQGEALRLDLFGQLMAATVLVTLPLIVLVLIFQQRIIGGLTATVKG